MPVGSISGITLHVSASLRTTGVLWPALENSLDGHLPWEAIDETVTCAPKVTVDRKCDADFQWAYLQTDSPYLAHRQACIDGPSDDAGTCFPLVLVFAEASACRSIASSMRGLDRWLRSTGDDNSATSAGVPLARARLLLILWGSKPATLRPDSCALLADLLLKDDIATVETLNAANASDYVLQCASSICECRKRRVPSRFKIPGTRCQTLPKDPADKLRVTWVSQLMQIPGVSEEIAKTVAERYPSPAAMLKAVQSVDPTGRCLDEGPRVTIPPEVDFLSDLEYPIRGRKSTRRIGPIVSHRILALFHADVQPDRLLL